MRAPGLNFTFVITCKNDSCQYSHRELNQTSLLLVPSRIPCSSFARAFKLSAARNTKRSPTVLNIFTREIVLHCPVSFFPSHAPPLSLFLSQQGERGRNIPSNLKSNTSYLHRWWFDCGRWVMFVSRAEYQSRVPFRLFRVSRGRTRRANYFSARGRICAANPRT